MKRSDITPGQVVGQISFRNSRNYWPVLVLSTESYRLDWRSRKLSPAGQERLVSGKHARDSVGLLAVHLTFNMTDGRKMDVLDFRAKVEKVRELASVEAAVAAIEADQHTSWDENAHRVILDDDGTLLGDYRLLTGLQMVEGDYIELVLAEQRAEAVRDRMASEAEQQRQANVVRYRTLAARLAELGFTGYHCGDWESPSRFEGLRFEDMDDLLSLAESAVRANKAAGIRD